MGLFAVGVAMALGMFSGAAEAQSRPGGCLKYGLGGAIAGHVAGGHRVKGALAGCALGVLRRRQYQREVRERELNRNRNAERGPVGRERAEGYPDRRREADTGRTQRGPFEDGGLPTGRGSRSF